MNQPCPQGVSRFRKSQKEIRRWSRPVPGQNRRRQARGARQNGAGCGVTLRAFDGAG